MASVEEEAVQYGSQAETAGLVPAAPAAGKRSAPTTDGKLDRTVKGSPQDL